MALGLKEYQSPIKSKQSFCYLLLNENCAAQKLDVLYIQVSYDHVADCV